jgi:Zn-dependent peptidase ImmA (M78 family)
VTRSADHEAAKLLARHNVTDLPVQVEQIAIDEGILISRVQFDGNESGFAMTSGGTRIIGVNQSNHRRRQRFTIAHELGHLLLHHGDGDSLLVDRSFRVNFRDEISSLATSTQEIEANSFAAALLMPPDLVVEEVERDGARMNLDQLTQLLSNRFDVSREAMGFRLMNLGVASV